MAAGIDAFIERLRSLEGASTPFTIVIDDPSGNSFIDNPLAPKDDPDLTISTYRRTREQNETLGLQHDPSEEGVRRDDVNASEDASRSIKEGAIATATAAEASTEGTTVVTSTALTESGQVEADEVLHIPSSCPGCGVSAIH